MRAFRFKTLADDIEEGYAWRLRFKWALFAAITLGLCWIVTCVKLTEARIEAQRLHDVRNVRVVVVPSSDGDDSVQDSSEWSKRI